MGSNDRRSNKSGSPSATATDKRSTNRRSRSSNRLMDAMVVEQEATPTTKESNRRSTNRRSQSSNKLMGLIPQEEDTPPEKLERRGRSSGNNKSGHSSSPGSKSRPYDKSAHRNTKDHHDEPLPVVKMNRGTSSRRLMCGGAGPGYDTEDLQQQQQELANRNNDQRNADQRRANRRRTAMGHADQQQQQGGGGGGGPGMMQKQRSRRRLSCLGGGAAAGAPADVKPLSSEMERRRSARHLQREQLEANEREEEAKERDQARIFDQALSKRFSHNGGSRSNHSSSRHPGPTSSRIPTSPNHRNRDYTEDDDDDDDCYSSDDDSRCSFSEDDITIDTVLSLEEDDEKEDSRSKGDSRRRKENSRSKVTKTQSSSSSRPTPSTGKRENKPIRRARTLDQRRVAASSASNTIQQQPLPKTTRRGLYSRDASESKSRKSLALLKLDVDGSSSSNCCSGSNGGSGMNDDESHATETTHATSSSSGSNNAELTAKKMKDFGQAFRSSQSQQVVPAICSAAK